MKHLALLIFAMLSMAVSAQTYIYQSEDSLFTLKYDAQQQRVKVHSPQNFFMMVKNNSGSTEANDLTPASVHNGLMPNQKVCVIVLWNDGRNERDLYFEPRTYRDAFYESGIFDGKFMKYMKSLPDTITLTLPLETMMVDVTFKRQMP